MTVSLRIGRYEVGEFIARGAHGSVCRVTDPDDGSPLVAKLYPPTGAPDPDELARWHQEFGAEVERLRGYGQDMLRIAGAGRTGDLAWVVTEPPRGEFLSDLLGDESLPIELGLELLRRIAAALDAMHAEGLVHRGLKPSNIIVRNDGSIRFADTLLLGRFAEAIMAGSLPLERVTCVSPEVVLGYRQRAASNQYVLAVIAHRTLTGRWPYAEERSVDYAYATVYGAPAAASSAHTGLPVAIDPVLHRALSKEPDDRYATCAEFIATLDEALTAVDTAPAPDVSESEPIAPIESAALPPDSEEPRLEWFTPAKRTFEIVAEPVPESMAPLRAVGESELEIAAEVDVRADPDTVAEPDFVSASTTVAPPAVLETPDDHVAALPPGYSLRPSLGQRMLGMGRRLRDLVAGLVGRGGRRTPDHLMREAYLEDWRGDAAQSVEIQGDWSDPITPEWSLNVEPAVPGWLRVDGRYAGPAPAEITIPGRPGARVLVELMRDGAIVDSTELRLHPLMDKTWAPGKPEA